MKQNTNLGRRAFLHQSAGIALAASSAGAGQVTAQTTTPSQGHARDFIIDAHIHCGGTDAWVNDVLRTYRPRKAMACVLTRMQDMELIRKAMREENLETFCRHCNGVRGLGFFRRSFRSVKRGR
jgi:hypothetical protein